MKKCTGRSIFFLPKTRLFEATVGVADKRGKRKKNLKLELRACQVSCLRIQGCQET